MTTITDHQMEMLVSDGIAFLRSITSVYGSEEGMKLWDTIANTLDPDIKGKIFFALLTGDHEDRVILAGVTVDAKKINCIKIIRQYTGAGLIEAKAAYEQAADYGKRVTVMVDPKKRLEFTGELRMNGMLIA